MNERREYRAPNPWQWLAFLAILVAGYVGLTRPDPSAPAAIAAPNAPVVETVVYVWTPTPTRTPAATQTPRIVVVTVTPSPTPVIPPCSQAEPGEACLVYPSKPTPAALVGCDKLTPSSYATQTCIKADAGTGNREETR